MKTPSRDELSRESLLVRKDDQREGTQRRKVGCRYTKRLLRKQGFYENWCTSVLSETPGDRSPTIYSSGREVLDQESTGQVRRRETRSV